MRNDALGAGYIRRAEVRLRVLDTLFEVESWADVVRESQEIVELTLKGLLRLCNVDPPRIHDVSEVLLAERERLPAALHPHLEELVSVSRHLRRDRELALRRGRPRRRRSTNDAVAPRRCTPGIASLAPWRAQPFPVIAAAALHRPAPPSLGIRGMRRKAPPSNHAMERSSAAVLGLSLATSRWWEVSHAQSPVPHPKAEPADSERRSGVIRFLQEFEDKYGNESGGHKWYCGEASGGKKITPDL
jgi:HEPN domain-containing protein